MADHLTIADVKPKEFVIVVGEPATGKTLNKEALRQHFGCEECYDCPGDEHQIRRSDASRILILTTDVDVKDPLYEGKRKPRMEGTRITVAQAREALGTKWVEPNGNRLFENEIPRKFSHGVVHPRAETVAELREILKELPGDLSIDPEKSELVVFNVGYENPHLSFREPEELW